MFLLFVYSNENVIISILMPVSSTENLHFIEIISISISAFKSNYEATVIRNCYDRKKSVKIIYYIKIAFMNIKYSISVFEQNRYGFPTIVILESKMNFIDLRYSANAFYLYRFISFL